MTNDNNDNNDNNEMDELYDALNQAEQDAYELAEEWQRAGIRLHNGLVDVFKKQTYTVEIEGPDDSE